MAYLESRSEESRAGQREKLGHNAVTTKASAKPTGAQSWDEGEGPGLCVPTGTSHWMQMTPKVCVRVCDPGWGQFLESVSEARGGGASVLEQGPESCITVSTTVDSLENRSEKKKTKMTPDPTNPRKGLTFWYISSPSFISYRYMYVY